MVRSEPNLVEHVDAYRPRTLAVANGDDGRQDQPIAARVAIPWAAAGIAGAAYRAVGLHQADGFALAFLAFAFVPFILNHVTSLSLPGGTKIELAKGAGTSVGAARSEYELAITDMATLMRDLIATQTNTASILRRETDRATAFAYVIQTLADAMRLSQRWLVRTPTGIDDDGTVGEVSRVTLWLWNEAEACLKYLCGTVDEDQARALFADPLYVNDADYMGDAWRNIRISGAPEAQDDWRPLYKFDPLDEVPYPPGGPTFHGLMFAPVTEEGHPVALLAFDREKARAFDSNARVIATALAALVANVMGDPAVRWGREQSLSEETKNPAVQAPAGQA